VHVTTETLEPGSRARDWDLDELTRALRETATIAATARVTAVDAAPLGAGLLADTYRLEPRYDPPAAGPARMVAKVPTADPEAARTAARIGAYVRECHFYEELAAQLPVRTPAPYGTLEFDGERTGLLLEDLTVVAVPGDQLDPPDPHRLALARRELAAMQAPLWGQERRLRPWMHRRTGVPIPAHVERYAHSWSVVRDRFGPALPPEGRRLIERFGAALGEWAETLPGPYTVAHHDFRFDNLMFSRDRAWVLDWQMAGWGAPACDLAYLSGSSVEPEQRRRLERGLVLDHLADLTERGVLGLTEEWGWTEYRRCSLAILLVIVPAAGTVRSTPRGDRMLVELLRRGTAQALDLGAEEFLGS
jgi:hypothetical protein